MRYIKIFIAMAIVAAIAILIILNRDDRREAIFYPFGGIPFKVVAYDRSPAEFDADMSAVRQRVAELAGEFNRLSESSELAEVNGSASVAPVAVGQDMAKVLATSAKWHMLSEGGFDPTVTPLIELWKVAGEKGELPSAEERKRIENVIGFSEIIFSHDGRIMFAKDGMALDFGAIAKGFMADEVALLLRERGVQRGIVDAGGNAIAFGEGDFTFGVADPRFSGREELMATVDVPGGAVITSGNYERYVSIGGKRFSHILDPRSGEPIENDLVAVTVVGGDGVDADAMATSLMVLGREKGMELVDKVPGVAALLVERSNDKWCIWASKSLQPDLKFSDNWAEMVKWF